MALMLTPDSRGTPLAAESSAPAAADSPPIAPNREGSPFLVDGLLRSGDAVLVDVREPDEHAHERISGATLIPLSRFDPQLAASLVAPGQKLVLHCKSGKRSLEAVRLIGTAVRSAPQLITLAGGIEAWKKVGLPVVSGPNTSGFSVMRQVQITIGTMVLGGLGLGWWVHPAFLLVAAMMGAGLLVAGVTGTCALATVLSKAPWNRVAPATCTTPQK